jgi:hypothetical protein
MPHRVAEQGLRVDAEPDPGEGDDQDARALQVDHKLRRLGVSDGVALKKNEENEKRKRNVQTRQEQINKQITT